MSTSDLEDKAFQAYKIYKQTNPNVDITSFIAGYIAASKKESIDDSITLEQYLRTKHPTINALTRIEANILGLEYPLKSGWVYKYGNLEIPSEILIKLNASRK
jgi:hypothetical protein